LIVCVRLETARRLVTPQAAAKAEAAIKTAIFGLNPDRSRVTAITRSFAPVPEMTTGLEGRQSITRAPSSRRRGLRATFVRESKSIFPFLPAMPRGVERQIIVLPPFPLKLSEVNTRAGPKSRKHVRGQRIGDEGVVRAQQCDALLQGETINGVVGQWFHDDFRQRWRQSVL
jgi:hypothetical protein